MKGRSLPAAQRAHVQRVRAIDGPAGKLGQPLAPGEPPEQRMRVEQDA
jgi:hypothetical protein